jgi:hypothetical protein
MQDGFSNQNPVLYYDGGVLHLFHSHAPANDGEGSSEIWHLQSTVQTPDVCVLGLSAVVICCQLL